MKAAWIEEFGSPNVIKKGFRDFPKRKEGEVIVRMKCSTINHHDLFLRQGLTGSRFLPVILGSDGAGVVESSGSSSDFKKGDKVVIYPVLSCQECINCMENNPHKCCKSFGMIGELRNGSHAEFISLPEKNLVKMPSNLSFTDAAAISLAGLTAWNMIFDEGKVIQGEHAMIFGASGGVGVFIIKLLKKLNLKVHIVTSNISKTKSLKSLGVDTVLNNSAMEILKFSKTLPNKGVDILFNCVGGNTWRYALPAVRSGGRIMICGSILSPVAELDIRQVFYRNISIKGCTMGNLESLKNMINMAASESNLRVPIDSVISIDDIEKAHERMSEAKIFGKIAIEF